MPAKTTVLTWFCRIGGPLGFCAGGLCPRLSTVLAILLSKVKDSLWTSTRSGVLGVVGGLWTGEMMTSRDGCRILSMDCSSQRPELVGVYQRRPQICAMKGEVKTDISRLSSVDDGNVKLCTDCVPSCCACSPGVNLPLPFTTDRLQRLALLTRPITPFEDLRTTN